MKILVSKNKRLYSEDKFIVEGENKVDKLEFEFPPELEDYIKFIVISSDEENYIDLIIDNEYIITRAISNLHNISIAVICTNSEIVSELTKIEDLNDLKDVIEFRSLSVDLPTMDFLVDLDTVENDDKPSAIARVYKKVLKNTEDIDTIKENQDNLKQNFENLETLKNEVVQEKENMQNLKKDIQNKLENGEFNGKDGLNGQDGKDGIDGAKGEKGDTGAKGDPFLYEDFTAEQLASLKGEKGDKGEQGIQGIQGLKGETGEKGDTGEKGNDGYTPQKGIDYYTEEDKLELKSEIEADLSNEELIKNMSFNSIEGETIDIDDAHSYSKNKLEIKGNLRQEIRKGYQLIKSNTADSQTKNEITFTKNEDNTWMLNGTATKYTSLNIGVCELLGNTEYTLSGGYNSGCFIQIIYQGGGGVTSQSNFKTFTQDTDCTGSVYIVVNEGTTLNNAILKPLLYEGQFDTDKKYEQFGAIPTPELLSKIQPVTGNINITVYNEEQTETKTIHLKNIELYGNEKAKDGFIKKSDGLYLMHNWKKYIFDGSEDWILSESNNSHNFTLSNLKIPYYPKWNTMYLNCNRFQFINTTWNTNITKMYVDTSGKLVITIASTEEKYCETVEDFKALLQEWNTEGNPLEIVYLLSEPTIEKITDMELIEDLEKLSKTKTYEGVNHIDSNSIAYLKLEYMQSNKILNQRKDEKIKNIESRLALLEV